MVWRGSQVPSIRLPELAKLQRMHLLLPLLQGSCGGAMPPAAADHAHPLLLQLTRIHGSLLEGPHRMHLLLLLPQYLRGGGASKGLLLLLVLGCIEGLMLRLERNGALDEGATLPTRTDGG